MVVRLPDPMWRDRAECRDAEPELFFPTSDHDTTAEALSYCRVCPVRSECEAFGLTQTHGIWGGQARDKKTRGLSACAGCERLMRPASGKIRDYPGTVKAKTPQLCATCWAREVA